MTSARPRLRRHVKRVLLPRRPRVRRLPLGIARGIRLEVDFDRHTKLFLGLYEVEIARHLRRFCRAGYQGYDVGSGTGYYALAIAALGGGRALAFEFDPSSLSALRTNIAANPVLAARVEICPRAVGSENDPDRGVVALDDVAYRGRAFVPDVLKIDIDGGEADALRGARRLLTERRPHAIVETHTPQLEAECAGLLREAGYRPVVVEQRRWLRDHRPLAHNRWLVAEGLALR